MPAGNRTSLAMAACPFEDAMDIAAHPLGGLDRSSRLDPSQRAQDRLAFYVADWNASKLRKEIAFQPILDTRIIGKRPSRFHVCEPFVAELAERRLRCRPALHLHLLLLDGRVFALCEKFGGLCASLPRGDQAELGKLTQGQKALALAEAIFKAP
ncbi:MAG: hypothetical protein A3H25_13770 [Sphingomonadales bacterium RIFCSPLOWO2_12_FULL_63_15]|nr:MAG: hypothetical protein A3H25_13770 [Sphingomonadales bacterium RIFCSPLOWO2_12_FULL_63_15]